MRKFYWAALWYKKGFKNCVARTALTMNADKRIAQSLKKDLIKRYPEYNFVLRKVRWEQ